LRACVVSGALIGGAADALLEALRVYARGIGLAFQIIDDILDVTASSEVLGKTAGKDLVADKTTYPKLLGLEESRRRAEGLVAEAKAALAPWDAGAGHAAGGHAAPLLALADYITSRDR
jgi:geranylgeranyl diphosphate synthase type II